MTPTVCRVGPPARLKLTFATPNVSPGFSKLKWPGEEKEVKRKRKTKKPENV